MAPFDPYHKWLGIPPEQQPASHYRLLGIEDFESDADVIEGAAERQTVYLRSFQTGPNSELAERLLNEVSEARVCLLTAADKADYDKRLRVSLSSGQPVAEKATRPKERDWTFATAELPDERDGRLFEPEELPLQETDPLAYSPDEWAPSDKEAAAQRRRTANSQQPFWQQPWAIPAAAGGIVVLLLLLMWLTSGGDQSPVGDKSTGPAGREPPLQEVKSPSPAIAPFDAQAAEKHQQQWATHLEIPVDITNSIGMKLKLIPPGEFMMGSTESDSNGRDEEKPQHLVKITKPFYLGIYEVTQQQYEKVMGSNPSKIKGTQNPVETVSWNDAVEFFRKLSEQEGVGYRLLTEAEWEYACRAGTTTTYSFGNDVSKLGQYAWYRENAEDIGEKYPHPVGRKLPNAWGLYDMHANVWEWCQDWHGAYPNSVAVDPIGPSFGEKRTSRGGSWINDAGSSRVTRRGKSEPDGSSAHVGFRIARTCDFAPERKTPVEATPAPAIAPFDAQAAEKHQKEWATHLERPVDITNSVGMKLKLIPPGEFMRGYTGHAQSHEVKITSSFYMGTHEVTQAQYEEVMGSNPSNFKGPQNPVETVSWRDAVEFCRKLSAMPAEKSAGRLYRLPTDAQWEYACRAGTTTKYSFGDEDQPLGDYAWYLDNSGTKVIDGTALLQAHKAGTPERRKAFVELIKENDCRTHVIGGRQANPWGLYDMHGNVWELCQDWYGAYLSGSVSDPLGPSSGTGRVHRGGDWSAEGVKCMSARRGPISPSHRGNTLGFRIAMSPTAAAEKAVPKEPDSIKKLQSDYRLFATLRGHTHAIWNVAFSPNQPVVASGSWDKTIKLWSTSTGELIQTLSGHSGAVTGIAFSPDGKLIASGSHDTTVKLWSVDKKFPRTLQGHKKDVASVAFSPDGELIASGSMDGTIKIWSTSTGQLQRTLSGHNGAYIAFHREGKLLAGTTNEGVTFWNLSTGVGKRLVVQDGAVWALSFSPDGKLVASGGTKKEVQLRNVGTGILLRTLQGHEAEIHFAAFNPNGRMIASSSWDHTVKLWEIASGDELKTLSGHEDRVFSVAFSPNGKLIATGSEDNTVKLWLLTPDAVVE